VLEGGRLMLRVDGCSKTYRVGTLGGDALTAVRNVSFELHPGEVVSLIGESGSGKSTIGKMILRLLRTTSGTITLDGQDISSLSGRKLKAYYGDVQGVFQDPFSSYNPIFKADRVFTLLRGQYFRELRAADWKQKLEASLDAVSLNPGDVLGKYPHQLSGGQLQRMLVARALLLDIRYLVADEIISMLDASTRIDVLNLLGELKARGLGVLFITHDLSLGNYISDRTMILRAGRVVELGPTPAVFGNPLHAYTKALLASVPQLHTRWQDLERPTETAAGTDASGELVEVEDGHFVALETERAAA
jgi:ABC-type oligopeptide transport system ATPase subunit